MITYKVVLDQRRVKSDGKYSIMFRITSNRVTSNYSSGIAVLKAHWNAEASLINNLCPNYRELNKSLTSKFLKAQKLILQLEEEGCFSFEVFKEQLNGKVQSSPKQQPTLFVAFAEKLISEMREVNRTGNSLVYQTAVNRVIAFCNNKHLRFEDVDYTFIDKFKHHLIKDGMKPNTVGNYLRSIRAIYNKAIKAKLVDRASYPFHEITIKTEKTAKRAISIEDIGSIYKAEYKPNSAKWHARNYFLLSFSLRGASFTDLAYLVNASIENEVLTYRRKKTGTSLTIKLLPLAQELLTSYNRHNTDYLLPIFSNTIEVGSLKSIATTRQWIKTTNKWLRRIAVDCKLNIELTTYVTRHTWATTAKRLGYSNELIAECLGHSYGNKVTNIYLDSFEQSLLDEVNEKVISCIL